MKKILTCFCFTDIHNQQSMLDYPTTLRGSLLRAAERSVAEFGMADLAIVGGDNLSDYPYWNRSCALPKHMRGGEYTVSNVSSCCPYGPVPRGESRYRGFFQE